MSNNKNKEEFLSKINKYNIPGWTDEELKEEFQKILDRSIETDLEEIIEKSITTCPICGNKYIIDNTCEICGHSATVYYGADEDYEKWIQKCKDFYKKKAESTENYIDIFDFNESSS